MTKSNRKITENKHADWIAWALVLTGFYLVGMGVYCALVSSTCRW